MDNRYRVDFYLLPPSKKCLAMGSQGISKDVLPNSMIITSSYFTKNRYGFSGSYEYHVRVYTNPTTFKNAIKAIEKKAISVTYNL